MFSACLHMHRIGDSRHAIATFDKKFKIFHFKHFHLKNWCLVHVYICTVWTTVKCDRHFCQKMQNFHYCPHTNGSFSASLHFFSCQNIFIYFIIFTVFFASINRKYISFWDALENQSLWKTNCFAFVSEPLVFLSVTQSGVFQSIIHSLFVGNTSGTYSV